MPQNRQVRVANRDCISDASSDLLLRAIQCDRGEPSLASRSSCNFLASSFREQQQQQRRRQRWRPTSRRIVIARARERLSAVADEITVNAPRWFHRETFIARVADSRPTVGGEVSRFRGAEGASTPELS